MVAATVVYEGPKEVVAKQKATVNRIAALYGGIDGGEESGKRGYALTYMIAYLRDFGLGYYVIAESFETSVPWGNVLPLCFAVKERIRISCFEHGIDQPPFVSCRVTQIYDVGVCVYFYFGFNYRGISNAAHVFAEIEAEARDEILRQGGSLSHHHGIGKIRKRWMKEAVSNAGVGVLRGLKNGVDPLNIFCAQNLV